MLGQALVIEIFVYPQDWIEHLGWAAMLGLILTRGPGVISLDYWLGRLPLVRRIAISSP